MNHDDLVERAAQWLANTRKCSPVFTEQMTLAESPDAIGWTWHGSILIECKVSIEDFAADERKVFRVDGYLGVGRLRYYMVPVEMANSDAFLGRFDRSFGWRRQWGLLACHHETKRQIVREVLPTRVQPAYSMFGEIRLLRAALLNGRPDHSLSQTDATA